MTKDSLMLVLFVLILTCCHQTTTKENQKTNSPYDSISSHISPEEIVSPYQKELNIAFANPDIDVYYKDIYEQEKLISTDDIKMLSITDSLFSNDPENDLFYFIVFTKSMNGSDGFYSEAVGLAAFEFITNNTNEFADYFNIAPKLTGRDMDNWATYICGEIQISNENHEADAIKELENKLLDNIKDSRKEYENVIKRLLEKIKSTMP